MPKVTILETGQTYEVPEGTAFIDFCQEHGVDHEFGCTVGSCGTCCLFLAAGADNVQPLTSEEQDTIDMVSDQKGARLGCQMVINGDVSVGAAEDKGHGGDSHKALPT